MIEGMMQKKQHSNKWAFGLGPLPATQPTSTKPTQLRLLQAFTSAWFRSNISQLLLPSLKNGRTFRTMKKHQPLLQLITAQMVVVTCCDGQNDVDNHDGDHLKPTYFAIFPCDTWDKKILQLPSAYASIVYIVHIYLKICIYIYLYASLYTSVNPRILAVYALFFPIFFIALTCRHLHGSQGRSRFREVASTEWTGLWALKPFSQTWPASRVSENEKFFFIGNVQENLSGWITVYI